MHDGMHGEEKDRAADRLPESREGNAKDNTYPAADAGNQANDEADKRSKQQRRRETWPASGQVSNV